VTFQPLPQPIFLSTSQKIGWKERRQYDLFSVKQDVEPAAAAPTSEVEAVVRSPTNMAAADIAAADFQQNDVTRLAFCLQPCSFGNIC